MGLRSTLSFASIGRQLILLHNILYKTASYSTSMSTTNLPRVTFYRRPLPPSCTALSSPLGRHQFQSSLQHHGCKSFFVLMEQFTTQTEPAYCGISSLVMVLNALAVDPRRLWKGNWRWYHEELLNCCMDLEDIKVEGITLNVFACLAKCQGLRVEKYFAQDVTIDDLRQAVSLATMDNETMDNDGEEVNTLLVVSYNRAILQQTGTGHFSPIAAYDPPSDQVLILDTARFKYGAHWVPLSLLFEAMLPLDPSTGKSRGYALLSYENDDFSTILPISILLRSSKSQNPVRQVYKRFLTDHGHQIRWEQVWEFWTKGGEDPCFIWSMLEPQLFPTDKESADAVDAVRSLIQTLISTTTLPPNETKCCSNDQGFPQCNHNCRAIPLQPEEAIFITYLASLSMEEREEIINSSALVAVENGSDRARQQLLVEAELVRYAIDVSDEMEEGKEQVAPDPLS